MRFYVIIALLAALAVIGQGGPIVYGSGANNALYTIDVNTGVTTMIGSPGSNLFYDIAFSSTLGLFGVTGQSGTSGLYMINKTNGLAALVGNVHLTGTSTNILINALVFSPTGVLYGAGGSTLYSIDPATAAATVIGSGFYMSSGDLEFDNLGNLYVTSNNSATDNLYRVSTTTGAGTFIGSTGFAGVHALAFVNGIMYGFTNPGGQIITINLGNGFGAATFSYNPAFYGAAVDPAGSSVGGGSSIPEPATLGLTGLALVGLGALRRSRS